MSVTLSAVCGFSFESARYSEKIERASGRVGASAQSVELPALGAAVRERRQRRGVRAERQTTRSHLASERSAASTASATRSSTGRFTLPSVSHARW
jgi:hypothetical protein